MFGVQENSGVIGFISLTLHNDSTAEIYVMGVQPSHHHKGIGNALLEHCENYLVNRGFHFLTVKTVSPSRECENYAKTRKFYEAMGFHPLEELKTPWGEANPWRSWGRHLANKVSQEDRIGNLQGLKLTA